MDTYTILAHLVPLLVTGDCREVGDLEAQQVLQFASGHDFYVVYNEEFPDDPEQYMAKCDATGRIGWCYEVRKG